MRPCRILDNEDPTDIHLASFLVEKMSQAQISPIRYCFKTLNLGFAWRVDLVSVMVFVDPRHLRDIHT